MLNKQIGLKLGISEFTVKAHRSKVMHEIKADSLAIRPLSIGEIMRSKLVVLLMAVAFLSVVGWTRYAHGQRTVTTRQIWEYHVAAIPGTGDCDRQTYTADVCEPIFARNRAMNERLLNQRAAEGWELTGIGTVNFYFRRAK